MKKYKHLTFFGLTLALIACNDEKKSDFTVSIDASSWKQVYTLDESVAFRLNETTGKTVDSVQYLINDKKVGSVKGNEVFNYQLTNEKHGIQVVKAIAYLNDETFENISRFNIFSKIQPAMYSYTILNTYPHDIKAYTQGLEFYGDVLIESTGNGEGIGTGLKGKSSIRKVDPKTGEVLKINELDDEIFGEGTTVLNDKIYQLTYLHNEGYVYNVETLEREQTLPYFQAMQGWGLTNDGTHLYMTDGSDRVYKINPTDFKMIDYFTVSLPNRTVPAVNELEWVNGEIYANFYGQDAVGIFSPEDGTVLGVLDLSDLKNKVTPHPDLDVLNGIAYNKKTNTFFVTGKNWDKMFEIRIDKN